MRILWKINFMKKQVLAIIGIIILILLFWGGNYIWKNFRGAGPAVRRPSQDITKLIPDASSPTLPEAINNTDFPLKLPKGFSISIFAKDLPGARVMAFDSLGTMFVSQTSQGMISAIEPGGKAAVVLKEFTRPHGLAYGCFGGEEFPDCRLYIAEETAVVFYPYDYNQTVEKRFGAKVKIVDLPKGGRHFTRTLGFGPEGRLYVSIGSSCDVCIEKDERLASIYSMNKDGSDFKKVASGLRNSVFFTWHPTTQKIWATEMGRDNLGDNLPPDEVNQIETLGSTFSKDFQTRDYGWPNCYGKRVVDDNFFEDARFGPPDSICDKTVPSYIDLPAHSAPLGLAFAPDSWPADYHGDLIVAFHGSWNRSEPTGYKLARVKLDAQGNYQGMEDFISGWLSSDGPDASVTTQGSGQVGAGKTSLGRPVDIIIDKSGIMYVSDDKAGVVYKVEYLGE